MSQAARLYRVHGRVQGVGYRAFARRSAEELGLNGWAKNLEDGSVEVYATGVPERLSEFAGRLRRGPRWSDVRTLEEKEAPVERRGWFEIR